MKASRFSDAQEAFILTQGSDGMPVADTRRKASIGQATYFNWKRKYDGLLPTDFGGPVEHSLLRTKARRRRRGGVT
jgi:putative transposase